MTQRPPARLRHPLWTKLLLAALVPLPFGILSGAWTSSLTGTLLEQTRQLVRESESEAAVHHLQSLVLEAESNERGYLLTANPTFLAAYLRAVKLFRPVLGGLRRAVGDDPAQSARLDEVEALFVRWRQEVAEPLVADRQSAPPGVQALLEQALGAPESTRAEALLALREAHGELLPALSAVEDTRLSALRPAAERDRDAMRGVNARITRRVNAFEGKAQTDAILERLDEVRHIETSEVRELAVAAARARDRTRQLALLSPLVSFALLMGAFLVVNQRVVRSARKLAQAAARVEAGALDERAQIVSSDEIAQVAGAFNRMAERLQARDRESESLRRLTDLLQACGSVAESLGVGVEMLQRLLPGRAGAVYLARGGQATRSAAFGPTAGLLTASFDLGDCWAARRSGSHQSSALMPVRCGHAREGMEDATCVPLLANGVAVGLLHLEPGEGQGPLGPGELRLAESVAEQLALAVANLSLRDMLREQAIRDPLTGLYNRRYLEESLGRELERARRRGGQFSVLVVDVDHFKRLNDTFGHDAGDLVLREVGVHLRGSFRGEDVCARLGGEEFAVVLSESALPGAIDRAERLREALSRLTFDHEGRQVGPVTVSVGVAHWPSQGATPADVLRAADAAMYRAKASGRNRVRVAGNPAADGKGEALAAPALRVVVGLDDGDR